jgi:hypothetical protein
VIYLGEVPPSRVDALPPGPTRDFVTSRHAGIPATLHPDQVLWRA